MGCGRVSSSSPGRPERAADRQGPGEAHPPDTLLPDFGPLELGDHAFLVKPLVRDTFFLFLRLGGGGLGFSLDSFFGCRGFSLLYMGLL